MKTKLSTIFILLLLFILVSCGTTTDTYQFLSYEIPSGYSKNSDSSTPLYGNDDGYSLAVDIEQSDSENYNADDMLNTRMQSDDTTEVTVVNDVIIDGITAKQYFTYYTDVDFIILNVSFIYNDNLVTLSVSSYNDEIPDNIVEDFEDFINSIEIK